MFIKFARIMSKLKNFHCDIESKNLSRGLVLSSDKPVTKPIAVRRRICAGDKKIETIARLSRNIGCSTFVSIRPWFLPKFLLPGKDHQDCSGKPCWWHWRFARQSDHPILAETHTRQPV